MKVNEIMTREAGTVRPEDSVQKAAREMARADVGVLPVVDGGRVVGVVTDRDIAIRSSAAGQNPTMGKVSDCMSEVAVTCTEDEDLELVIALMERKQIRRVPVIEEGGDNLVGVVSVADIARRLPEHITGRMVQRVCGSPSSTRDANRV